jgi:flagellar L-ring protein precursor FlgH
MSNLKLIIFGVFSCTICACASAPQPVAPMIPYESQTPSVRNLDRNDQGNAVYGKASLWNNAPNSLFGDRRARGLGDILTVQIDIDDEAEMRNSVSTDRQSGQSFGIGNLFGLKNLIEDILPSSADLDNAVSIERESNVNGSGQLRRGEKLTLTLAANVVDITPNGDLEISGYQDIRVNNEVRLLAVSGFVRREDITRRNVVSLEKIANARVVYGGRGQVTRAVRDKTGQRVLDNIIPF